MRGTRLLVVSMLAACAAHPRKPGVETPPPTSTTGPAQPFDENWERAEPKGMTAEERVRYDLKVAEGALRANRLDVAERAVNVGLGIFEQPAMTGRPELGASLFRVTGLVHVARKRYAEAELAFGQAVSWYELRRLPCRRSSAI